MRIGATSAVLRALLSSAAVVLPIAFSKPALAAAQDPPPRTKPLSSAQSVPPTTEQSKPRSVEETAIVITGSRIPRTNLTAVSPVTMIKSDEVRLEGTLATEDLLNRLPQVAPDQGAFVSNGATGTATVNLRNLGAPRTLVLVNGRRLGPGDPLAPVPDLNTVPASWIQRVEVLTGGATSVYGSDSVAGVVNFILDTRFDGLRFDGETSYYQHYNATGSAMRNALAASGISFPSGNVVDGARRDINVGYGQGFFDGRLHATVYAGYRHLEALTQDRRDYSSCAARVDNEVDNTLLLCGGSDVSYPGNFVTGPGDVFELGPGRTFQSGVNIFNFAPYNYYQRPDDRYTAGAFLDADFAKELKPYLELMFMKDRSVAQIAPSGDFGNTQAINCDNPLLSDQQRTLVCYNGNFVGQQSFYDDNGNLIIQGTPRAFVDPVTGATYFRAQLEVLRRAIEGGGRQDDLRHKMLRVVGGFRGDLGRGISYDASYIWHRARLSDAHLNDLSVEHLVRALDVVTDPTTGRPACRSVLTREDPNCVPWDVFAIGAVTPEANAYLTVSSLLKGSMKERVANVNATIDLGEWGLRSPWALESPAINIGAEYRKDTLDLEPDIHFQIGDLAGSGFTINPLQGSTNTKELFAETRIPLVTSHVVERFALEAGYRKSRYAAGGAKFSSDAYKVGLDFTPVRGLRLRASQQRATRAPNIQELFTPPSADAFFHDPCAGLHPQATESQCAPTGVSAAQYGHILAIPENAFLVYNATTGANLELQPEVATTRSAGLVLEPQFLRGFNATVDWWDIKLNGAVSYVDGDTIIDTCTLTGDPIFCTRIHRDATGSLWLTPQGYIDTRLFNIGSIRTGGVDVSANYRRSLGRIGSASVDLLGTYVDRYTVDNGGLSTIIECAGHYGLGCFTPIPRWRHTARLTWEAKSGLSISLDWRYTGSMSLDPPPSLPNAPGPFSRRLTAQSFFDLAALFRFQRRYQLRFGVNNFFDKEPPLIPTGEGGGAGPLNGNTYPMWYDPLGRYIFAGVTVKLNPF